MSNPAEITKMEEILNQQTDLLAQVNQTLDHYEALQEDYQKLKTYYNSEAYFADVAADAQGDLPADLPRGVLSEDAVYDLMGDQYQLAIRFLELGTNLIKNY